MASKRKYDGQSIEDAVRAASQALGIPIDDLDYVLLDEGRRGVLGVGARKCRIEVRVPPQLTRLDHDEEEEEFDGEPELEPKAEERKEKGTEPEGAPEPEKVPKPLEAAQQSVAETLERMFELMDVKLRIRSKLAGNGLRVQLSGPDRKMLTAKDGQLLSSLQFLLNRMARRAWPDLGRLQLTCDGYRNRRDDDLVELVREVASQVKRTGHPKKLHPMNPYERRLAHLTVREFNGLVSRSDGDGFTKKITIAPEKNNKKGNRRR